MASTKKICNDDDDMMNYDISEGGDGKSNDGNDEDGVINPFLK